MFAGASALFSIYFGFYLGLICVILAQVEKKLYIYISKRSKNLKNI